MLSDPSRYAHDYLLVIEAEFLEHPRKRTVTMNLGATGTDHPGRMDEIMIKKALDLACQERERSGAATLTVKLYRPILMETVV